MANIFVDPVIVAIPNDGTDRDEIVAWIKNLDLWLQEALSTHFLWLHATNVTDLLEIHGRFPNFGNLRNLKEAYNLDINLAMLMRKVNTFFRDPVFDLGDKLDKLGYLAELKEDSVTILPATLSARWPVFIQTAMHSLLITSCVCKQTAHAFASTLYIATMKYSDHSQEMTISATITYTIPELACQPGDVISQAFPLLFTPDDLLPLIDVMVLWLEGESGVIYAIEQLYKKHWHKSGENPLQFSLGSHFCESIISSGLETHEITLHKIVKLASATIADQVKFISSAKLHPLRVNLAGDSPQRIRSRDQATAWRLDVTKHGAGWRLHYWHIPGPDGGSIEFSNICKESDDTIYE